MELHLLLLVLISLPLLLKTKCVLIRLTLLQIHCTTLYNFRTRTLIFSTENQVGRKEIISEAQFVKECLLLISNIVLSCRKGGCNKLIKIASHDGLYGFSKPFQFHSVMELVDYYRNNSLSEYNTSLNTCLLSPVSRNPVCMSNTWV